MPRVSARRKRLAAAAKQPFVINHMSVEIFPFDTKARRAPPLTPTPTPSAFQQH
jgi:hypothetical protein